MAKQDTTGSLFSAEELTRAMGGFDFKEEGPVTCLGKKFENEEDRRAYFREELRKKLPELRKIEGFPIGDDEDIIKLSDPPYYTACPNPWLNDFIVQWEEEKKQMSKEGIRNDSFIVKEPYFHGISAKKNHPIYNAHSYHTKVPHEVIMRYLFHYTQPGDIIIDNFGGTGMTGVAANEISKPHEYSNSFSDIPNKKWGYRNCILGDLSPIASFITHNYTSQINSKKFKAIASIIFKQLENELSWMYTTKDGDAVGNANYYIWSEVQVCPYCGKEFVYWDAAVDFDNSTVKDKYSCPYCASIIAKRDSQKAVESFHDDAINESYGKVKYVPVIVNYTIGGKRKERVLNDYDREIISKISNTPLSYWHPKNKMMGIGEKWGDTWRAGYHIGFNHVHNFYTRRNLLILSRFYSLIEDYECDGRTKSYLLAWFTSSLSRLHIMNRYAANHHRHVGPLANTLYVSGTPAEISPFYFIKSKIKDNDITISSRNNVVNQIASATTINLPDNVIDYIFTDPPFGGNIMYSELNFISEAWLKVFTNNDEEAITNDSQHKGAMQYQELMLACFKEYFRLLKPNGWMTVEFSNTSAAIWNAIQQSIQQAGFVIAYVADLNKGRGGLHGIYNVVAVNQDLAITCYKPSNDLDEKAKNNSIADTWSFVDDYLEHLPVHTYSDQKTTTIVERNPKILYDRLISYYVQRGYPVPIDASDFQQGLKQRYIERDGMYFTAIQAVEYEEKKKMAPEFVPMGLIVSDEENGIAWLKNELKTPQTYQDIQPKWLQAVRAVKMENKLPELKTFLEENFIEDSDGKWRIADPEKQADLDKLYIKNLMKEFNVYVEAVNKPKAKPIKQIRIEAVRAGFKACYKKKDFSTIIKVGDKIPQTILQEDEQLLRYYDVATRHI
jgi:DNA modification methylase